MSASVTETGPALTGGRPHQPACAVGAVMLGSYMVGFHGRLFGIGFADLRGAFSLGIDEGAWLNTAAMAPQIFVAPAVAWLVITFGMRRVLAVPTIIYTILSIIIPFVRSYELLVVLHIMHGLLLGLFVPATILVILRNLPTTLWLPALGLYAFRTAFSLNSGVSIVTWYVESIGWQWVYWQDAFIAPLMGILVFFGTYREGVDIKRIRSADWAGMLLLGTGMAMLFAGLDQGNRLGWMDSPIVGPLLASGSVLIFAFLINEAVLGEPWARIDVLASRNVGLSVVVVLMFTATSLSNTLLVPGFLSTVAYQRPQQIGHLLLAYVAVPLIGTTALCVWLLRWADPRFLLAIGMAAFAVAALLGSHVTRDWESNDFIPAALLQSVGFGFTLLPLIVIGIANLSPTRSIAFSAYIQVVRLVGNELALALITAFIMLRRRLHLDKFGHYLTANDVNVRAWSMPRSGFNPNDIVARLAENINSSANFLYREATVLAYADAFRLAFWAAVAGLAVVAFIGKAPPGPLSAKGLAVRQEN